ncbi:hypothetical protein QBC32DRAFT_400616 [Pseudoneurospora amorphoporcata]|uniref:WD40 repeat-like protein n=1 Tax=Pseudoneurospora amorphoporcata TaxID=241081 RepID=A0AAN6NN44_9PEZI|nr:hypothetical protein QBC32DRAFT_400616 [Pseudoneurospora amorphoporcata]
MAELRGDIETYRRALGLVLDVVNYHQPPVNSDTSDLEASRSQITTEVDRLRSHNALTGLINRNTWLEPYMNAVINCLETSCADSPNGVISLNLESRLPATPPTAPTQQEVKQSSPRYVINIFESAGPWHPAGDIALPFYNGGENRASAASSTRREAQKVSPRLRNTPLDHSRHAPTPESPTSIQFSQRAQSPPSSQQSWDQGSPSTRSEPFEASFVPHQDLRADRWSEPQPVQNSEQYGGIFPPTAAPSIATMSTSTLSASTLSPATIHDPRWSPTPQPQSQQWQATTTPLSAPPQWSQTKPAGHATAYSSSTVTVQLHRAELVPVRHLTDKGKGSDVFHIDCSPTASYLATRHSNNTVKIWAIAKNTVHSTIKIKSYVPAQPRSREYFVRSHSILSEGPASPCFIGITTHFGLDLEIYNFTKGGSGKKVQVIDEAHRWAASHKLDNSYAPLVVYRPGADRIDRYFLSRNPSAKKPFWEDASSCIDLTKAHLPFLPKYPELAFSNDAPFLIAAAGPRPGDPPRDRKSTILLVAWHLTPVREAKLAARSPVNSVHSHIQECGDPNRHKPYRFVAPAYAQLQTALPSVLASHGSVTVSIWIPASYVNIPLPGGKFRQTRVPTPERFVLVWNMPTNATRLIPIPNVQACVSPDCRLVAYCDPEMQKFVILDVSSTTTTPSGGGGAGEEVWKWPDAAKVSGFASFGQFEAIKKITVFEFSPDGKWLIVGDANGALGVYKVREAGTRFELLDQSSLTQGVLELRGNGGVPRGNVAELM